MFEVCHTTFQFFVDVHRSRNCAHSPRSDTEVIQRFFGCLYQAGMVCQPKVVVGAKIQYFSAVHHQPGALGRAEGADVVIQSFLF